MRRTQGPKGFPVYDAPSEVASVDHMDVLKRHEGFNPDPYQDFEGEWRIGFGSYVAPGLEMDERTAASIAKSRLGLEPMDTDEEQVHRFESSAYNQMGSRYQELRKELPAERFGYNTVSALANFSLLAGRKGQEQLKPVLKALQAGDRDKAFAALVSTPAAERDPERVAELASMLRFGD